MTIDKFSKMTEKEIDEKIDQLETCRVDVNRNHKENLSKILEKMNDYHFPKRFVNQLNNKAKGEDTVTIGTSWLPNIDPYEKHEFIARRTQRGIWHIADNGSEMCLKDSKWCVNEIISNERVLNKFLTTDKETRKKMIY